MLIRLVALMTMLAGIGMAAGPNVIVILTDDQGWGDLSIHGNEDLETPNIDRLAKAGARFDRFFVQPVCSPTRAEFLTGRYASRSGVTSTSAGGERMALTERTIGDAFKAAGYRTGAFGKWHNGMQWPYHPNARGFDEFYGFCSGHWAHYFDHELEHNGTIVDGKGFIIDDLTDRAIEFMSAAGDKPFFVYLPYNTPHSPMQVPDAYWDRFKDKKLRMPQPRAKKNHTSTHTLAALAMCENIDWNVGRVLKKVDELGKRDDTIVVYFCDNGPNGPRWNGAMKGRKGSTDEGGVRSPLFVRWPNKIPADTLVKPIAGAIDLLPTLVDLAGITQVGELPLDGISLKPALVNKATLPDRHIVSHWRNKTSVRTQQYRLDHTGKLFDMIADPKQTTPINSQVPEVAKRLATIATTYNKTAIGPNAMGQPFAVGHKDRPLANLPARDGVAHGPVKRSNRFPNSSYFLNWTSADAYLSWDVEVANAGTYEAILYYTCKPENVGCTITLAAGNAATSLKISEAHDPLIIGPADDRSPRMESPMKHFRPLSLGTLQLAAGRQELKLSAKKLQGPQAIEVRRLMLRLLP